MKAKKDFNRREFIKTASAASVAFTILTGFLIPS
jgi:hypothetical protein